MVSHCGEASPVTYRLLPTSARMSPVFCMALQITCAAAVFILVVQLKLACRRARMPSQGEPAVLEFETVTR